MVLDPLTVLMRIKYNARNLGANHPKPSTPGPAPRQTAKGIEDHYLEGPMADGRSNQNRPVRIEMCTSTTIMCTAGYSNQPDMQAESEDLMSPRDPAFRQAITAR